MKHLFDRMLAALAKRLMLAYLNAAIAAEVREQLARQQARQVERPATRRFVGQ